jgi:phytoene dehydrogenase-like protein
LRDKYLQLGGELQLGCGVSAIHTDADGGVSAVDLDDGATAAAVKVISSIGYVETLRLCGSPWADADDHPVGRVSFTESIFVLDRPPRDLGFDKSIVFFCTQPRFTYRVPEEPVDVRSGVLCCPNNFRYDQDSPEGCLRLTNLANFDFWSTLQRPDYLREKKQWRERALAQSRNFFPDFRDSVVFLDTFTPKTIFRYTGHLNGAVYGSPRKIKSGITPVKNLYICGTDQGFLGIVGATLSGISMANLHILKGKAASL